MVVHAIARASSRPVLMGSLLLSACSGSSGSGPRESAEPELGAPYELSAEECANLLSIETSGFRVKDVEGPSATEVAIDTLNPSAADRSEYSVLTEVDQTFENLLDRAMRIEEASATVTPAGIDERYETSYDLEAPIELVPLASSGLTFSLVIPGDEVSVYYLLGLLENAPRVGFAPVVRVTIPGTDNCGYPDGIVVRAEEGTVEVVRPSQGSDLLDAFLKGILHNL